MIYHYEFDLKIKFAAKLFYQNLIKVVKEEDKNAGMPVKFILTTE